MQVPLERLAQRLPAGFAPVAGAVPGHGVLALETDRCASIVGLDGRLLEAKPYAAFWTLVTPPERLKVEGIASYYVGWESLIADEEQRDRLRAAGVPAVAGDVRAPTEWTTVGRAFRVEVDLEGQGTFVLEGAGGSPVDVAFGGRLAQYVQGSDGSLSHWTWNWTQSTSALPQTVQGVVTLPEGSWLRDLFGESTVRANFNIATWTYSDGSIEWPIQN